MLSWHMSYPLFAYGPQSLTDPDFNRAHFIRHDSTKTFHPFDRFSGIRYANAICNDVVRRAFYYPLLNTERKWVQTAR